MPHVSIIVPVYNAAPFLAQCLDALLAQTLTDLEILAVDDGSRDGSADILAAYQKDTRVRVLLFPENRGVSAARNAGLAAATGAFIGFCDADDWAEPTMYATLTAAAVHAHAQMALCAVVKDMPSRSITVQLPYANGTVLDAAAIRGDLVPRMIALERDGEDTPLSGYTPRNLFARTLLAGHAFRPDIHYAEDLLFIVEALLDAQRAVVVAAPLYHYRFHSTSATQAYNPHLPASLDLSQHALTEALDAHGLGDALAPRLAIRTRRNALGAVRNLCLRGTPHAPLPRIAAIRAYLNQPQVRAAFADVDLSALPRKLRLQYGWMRGRHALPLMLLFSYVYQTR